MILQGGVTRGSDSILIRPYDNATLQSGDTVTVCAIKRQRNRHIQCIVIPSSASAPVRPYYIEIASISRSMSPLTQLSETDRRKLEELVAQSLEILESEQRKKVPVVVHKRARSQRRAASSSPSPRRQSVTLRSSTRATAQDSGPETPTQPSPVRTTTAVVQPPSAFPPPMLGVSSIAMPFSQSTGLQQLLQQHNQREREREFVELAFAAQSAQTQTAVAAFAAGVAFAFEQQRK